MNLEHTIKHTARYWNAIFVIFSSLWQMNRYSKLTFCLDICSRWRQKNAQCTYFYDLLLTRVKFMVQIDKVHRYIEESKECNTTQLFDHTANVVQRGSRWNFWVIVSLIFDVNFKNVYTLVTVNLSSILIRPERYSSISGWNEWKIGPFNFKGKKKINYVDVKKNKNDIKNVTVINTRTWLEFHAYTNFGARPIPQIHVN